MNSSITREVIPDISMNRRLQSLLEQMTPAEKVGQMRQVDAGIASVSQSLAEEIRTGRIGSVINQVDVKIVNELQRIAIEESRLKIPLLIGRDVIHGFKTVMPIPLGQAATWNPDLVTQCAIVAGKEAASTGVNWTFAPMLDISRDPRWGRIAESFGEDPFLTGIIGEAMVRGFQGNDMSSQGSIAACAKHFAGYGAAESGRDYATTNIPENELRNTYLPPFESAINAGAATVMTSFSDLNGVPATGNSFLLRQILREEWKFDGFVVSDWDSVRELTTHGFAEDDKQAALEAVSAGVDMEMAGDAYINNLEDLLKEGRLDIKLIDQAVWQILKIKIQLGLFEKPYTDAKQFPPIGCDNAKAVARKAALESVVMLKNAESVLPLSINEINSLAIIGPLADAPYEQLGTWIFDGDPEMSVTGLEGIRNFVGDEVEIHHYSAMETSRSRDTDPFAAAEQLAAKTDAAILFLGEESILSGEAHCRADISLPGAQAELVRRIKNTGKPVIAVIMAGRPLTLTEIVNDVDAILYAWHPGTMGGAAIADLLFGIESPSGKLPVTFPAHVGQIPLYYNHKNTGKPPTLEAIVHIDDIDANAPQTSLGMCAFHLDAGYKPLFPFGYGLSYTHFSYSNLKCEHDNFKIGATLNIQVEVSNTGKIEADEIVQLYVRDMVANVTRPVRELKGFRRIRIKPGETSKVVFSLHSDALSFYGRDQRKIVEPGEFKIWVGGNSDCELESGFTLIV